MKVLLLANYLNDEQESMKRFAALMERGLTRAGHNVRVVRPKAYVGRLHASAQGLGKWLGYVDKFVVFPPFLRSAVKWADVVHICDHSNAFYTGDIRVCSSPCDLPRPVGHPKRTRGDFPKANCVDRTTAPTVDSEGAYQSSAHRLRIRCHSKGSVAGRQHPRKSGIAYLQLA